MISLVKSMTLYGLEGELIEIQTYITGGLPGFEIVGLPDISVKEAKERVKAAIKNTGIEFPSRKIIINLAPADKRKEGSYYDLPIAMGMLIALNVIHQENEKIQNAIFIGELSLNGNINKVNGILPMCIQALQLGIKNLIIPKDNENEARIIKGINIIGVRNLKEVILYINGEIEITKANFPSNPLANQNIDSTMDFSEVKGQKNVKRALEIAAAGGHNCMLIGGPGSRKNNDG